MKPRLITALIVAAATASLAIALPINVTVDDSGSYLQNGTDDAALSLASKAFYRSAADLSNGNPNNRETNFKFLESVVSNWNTFNPDLPTPILGTKTPADNGSIGDTNGFTAPAGYQYVVFHFGNGPAGAGGGRKKSDENGWWSAWYLGGAGATFSLPKEGDPLKNVGGFSSARFFNPTVSVPDGGTTIALLGLTLLGLGAIRRRVGNRH